jgi:hypothetical protein
VTARHSVHFRGGGGGVDSHKHAAATYCNTVMATHSNQLGSTQPHCPSALGLLLCRWQCSGVSWSPSSRT